MAEKVEYKGLTHCEKTGDIVHPIAQLAMNFAGKGIFYKDLDDDFGDATKDQIENKLYHTANNARPQLFAKGAKRDKTRGKNETCITLASFEKILRKSYLSDGDPRKGGVFCLEHPDVLLADDEITKYWKIPYDRWISYYANPTHNPHPKIPKKAGSKKPRKRKIYQHYRNSISLYFRLKMEAERIGREIKINAEGHDAKKMPRELHDANMVQMFSSRLIAGLADNCRGAFETKEKLGTTVKTISDSKLMRSRRG